MSESDEKKMYLADFDKLQDHKNLKAEDFKVKLHILCNNRHELNSVGTYLNRRGWEVTITTKVEDCIFSLSRDKADFVFISVNHPNKKAIMLSSVITQSFGISCIAFGENTDNKSIRAIHGANTEHKVLGSLSGPSVHRKIIKIVNEQIKGQLGSKATNQSLKGNRPEAPNVIIQKSEPSKVNCSTKMFKSEAVKTVGVKSVDLLEQVSTKLPLELHNQKSLEDVELTAKELGKEPKGKRPGNDSSTEKSKNTELKIQAEYMSRPELSEGNKYQTQEILLEKKSGI